MYRPEFEYDRRKSEENKAKHGIDFVEAQALWDDEGLLCLPARSDAERRVLFVGTIEGRCWSAIATMRGESVRLISVRRARLREVQAYESQ